MSPRINHTARLLDQETNDDPTAASRVGPDFQPSLNRRPQVMVSSEYEPQTGTYQTNQFDVGGIKQTSAITHHLHHHQQQQQQQQHALAGFRDYISYALITSIGTTNLTTTKSRPSGTLKRIDYLISGLFYLNVLMSILNTVLLSFLVKSVQLSGHNLLSRDGGGGLEWDSESPESTLLSLPAYLRGDKFLSVGTIESNQDKPLIIEAAVHTSRSGQNKFATSEAAKHAAGQPTLDEGTGIKGQILISAKPRALAEGSKDTTATNYILVPAAGVGPSPSPSSRSFDARRHKDRRRPVEIVANSLILNQLNNNNKDGDDETLVVVVTSSKGSRNISGRSKSYGIHSLPPRAPTNRSDQLRRQTMGGGPAAQGSSSSRRLLELDGQSQTIVLPLLNKIGLFPSNSRSLFVKDELKCNSGISGRLDDNFDIQTRWGNLSFQSGRTLRIVSRSDKLNLASTRLLTLEAPTLRFSVPQTNKVFISDGIEFFELDQHQHQVATLKGRRGGGKDGDDDEQLPAKSPPVSASSPSLSQSLEAFKLVLIDDILMASQD